MKRVIAVALCIVVLLTFVTGSALAWCGYNAVTIAKYYTTPIQLDFRNVHYGDTYQWARDMGFKANEAQIIASACADVDNPMTLFTEKSWHLGTKWVLGATFHSANPNDERIQHVNYFMACAKDAISKVPGLSVQDASQQRILALTYLGNGLHALQDYYAHMNAGKNAPSSGNKWLEAFHHGETGVKVDVYKYDYRNKIQKYNKQFALESLLDSTSADYASPTANESPRWIIRPCYKNSRWLSTRQATYDYLKEYLDYGYGPKWELWTGKWDTSYGTMVLKQTGNQVSGVYFSNTHQKMGTINGSITENKLTGTWSVTPTNMGDFEYTISRDYTTFAGKWKLKSDTVWNSQNTWTGSKLPAQDDVWSGTWDTTYGRMTLVQTGLKVVGKCTNVDNTTCTIDGLMSGNILSGKWAVNSSRAGDFKFTVSADHKSFTGNWTHQLDKTWNPTKRWNGTRI